MPDFESKLSSLIENYENKVDEKRNKEKENQLKLKKQRELEIEKFATIRPQILKIIEQLGTKHISSITTLEISEDRKLILYDEDIWETGAPIKRHHYFGCGWEKPESDISEIKFTYFRFTTETREPVRGIDRKKEYSEKLFKEYAEKLFFETGEELLEHLLKIVEVILVREANNS